MKSKKELFLRAPFNCVIFLMEFWLIHYKREHYIFLSPNSSAKVAKINLVKS